MVSTAPAPAPLRELPGPGGLPLVGALPGFARDPLAFLERVAREHGDLARFRLVQHDIVLLSHPELVDALLVRHAGSLHKDAIYDVLRAVLGNGLVTSEGAQWRRNRKLAAPSFTARHVEVYADTMVRCARDFVKTQLAEGQTLDLHAAMMDLSRVIVLETLFGRDLDVDSSPVAHAIDVVMEAFVAEVQGVLRLVPRWIPTPRRHRARRAIGQLDRTIYALIESRRAAGLGDDLLSRLIAARDEAGGLTDVELRDEAVTAFLAGHETTALALTQTHVLLQESPEARQRLIEEVRGTLGERAATVADLAALPFTRAVILEAMRVLPPVWAIGREAIAPIALGGTNIPVGTQLVVAPWVLHRDGRWFDEPLAFRPERWLDGLEQRLPRMAYLPFGAGSRVCIGKHFAMMEAVLVLATLVQSCWLAPTAGRPRLVPSITLRPAGSVPARVERG